MFSAQRICIAIAATTCLLLGPGTAAAQDPPVKLLRPPELGAAGGNPASPAVPSGCWGSADVTNHGDSWIEKRLNWQSNLTCVFGVWFHRGSSLMGIKRAEDLNFGFPHGHQWCAQYSVVPGPQGCRNEGSSGSVLYPITTTLYTHGIDFTLSVRDSQYRWAGPTSFCPDMSIDLKVVRCHLNLTGYVGGTDQYVEFR